MNNWGTFTNLLTKTIQSAERSLDKVFEADPANKNSSNSPEKKPANQSTPTSISAPVNTNNNNSNNSENPSTQVPVPPTDPSVSNTSAVPSEGSALNPDTTDVDSSSGHRGTDVDSSSGHRGTDVDTSSGHHASHGTATDTDTDTGAVSHGTVTANTAPDTASDSTARDTDSSAVNDTPFMNTVVNNSTATKSSTVEVSSPLPNKASGSESELRAQLSLAESKLHAASVILTERERQLEVRSEEQSRLQRDNELLRATLTQQRGADGLMTFDSLTAEFSQRLGSLERKLRDVTRERDTLKRQTTQPAQQVTPVNTNIAPADSALVQKLKQDNHELKQEGLKLARDLGDREKQLKKIRTQSTEDQREIRSLKEKLASTESALSKTTEKLSAAEQLTAKYESTIDEFKSITHHTARQFEEKEKVSNTALDQLADLKHALESAWRDLAEERKRGEELQRSHRSALTELEQRLKEEQARDKREHVTELARQETQWRATVEQLRESLALARDSNGELSENYQKEITEERNKVLKLEQDLREAQSLTFDSTKPLLREVQQLQTRLQQLQTQHVTAEDQWRARVASEEQRAVTAVNESRDWQNKVLDLRKQVTALEGALETERQQHRAATSTNKEMRATEQQLRDHISQLSSDLTALKRTIDTLQSESTKKETELNHVIAAQKMKLDDLATQLAEQRQLLAMQSATINSAPQPSPSLSRVPSRAELTVAPSSDTWPQAHTMEKLKLATQQRELDVQRLQTELTNQRAENARLSDHVLALSADLDTLKRENGSLKLGESRVKDLETRYLAALEMLGEKSERVEEMSGDLSEFRRLYKQQINALCAQLEDLTRRNRELENRLKG